MKIIRPYGTSRSKKSAGTLRRVLIDNSSERVERDILDFAKTHNELVIAQWISTIDKIACKPKGDKQPSADQREFRERLGIACWDRLVAGRRLRWADNQEKQFLEALWWFKVHPYKAGICRPQWHKDGKPKIPRVKGSSYGTFAGDCDPKKVDATPIAERVEEHLYRNEYRRGFKSPPKPGGGRIALRAQSIQDNVLQAPDVLKSLPQDWTDADIEAYRRPGDPVELIRAKAASLEGQRMSLPIAAEILFNHWAAVFPNGNGGALCRRDAQERHPGMVALHDALKQCYRRLLKRSDKDTRENLKRNFGKPKLPRLLPKNIDEALRRSTLQQSNSELAGLVRLGKVIHYAASDGAIDQTVTINKRWPDAVAHSRFWQSEGQAEIKRAEAFVRVWRQALVFARWTLTDWVSMKEGRPFKEDTLGGTSQRDQALGKKNFDPDYFDRKVLLLFGSKGSLFALDTDEKRRQFLGGLIDGARNLRHAVFHFTGRGRLLDELGRLPGYLSKPVMISAQKLWQDDARDFSSRLKADLLATHVQDYLTQDQAAQVFALLVGGGVAELPLPRFSRVLLRRKNAWDDRRLLEQLKVVWEDVRLPEPTNRRALEVPHRSCQFTLLKLIYERPFRTWLKKAKADAISAWIDTAISRTSTAAKRLNAKRTGAAEIAIAARASRLPKLVRDGDITSFFEDLSSQTASELRVQRGYENNPESARKQASYIDELLCDVVILAFRQYLSNHELLWLLDIREDELFSASPKYSLEELSGPELKRGHEDWQAALYLILHLLPVQSVAQLFHQLVRWNIAAGLDPGEQEADRQDPRWTDQRDLRLLLNTLTLYLDMHDAKFEGGFALTGCERFSKLFLDEKDFSLVFPKDAEIDARVPRRGLREIMRFGHLPLLLTICSGRIDGATIKRVGKMEAALPGHESLIAEKHRRREALHDRWVSSKRGGIRFEADDLREYAKLVVEISAYHENSNLVRLVDHIRVHRLILAIQARLVDYAAIFERDLYFVTLALLHQNRLTPRDLFPNEEILENFSNGMVIKSICQYEQRSDATNNVIEKLGGYLSDRKVKIRNALAHLDFKEDGALAPRLTHRINQARQLLDYDRKLKNAVSKSVIDLLAREGMGLQWEMAESGETHDLSSATLVSGSTSHLGGKSLSLKQRKAKPLKLLERLHGEAFVGMIAAAFEGTMHPAASIADRLGDIDWEASTAEKSPRKHDEASKRPSKFENNQRPKHRPQN